MLTKTFKADLLSVNVYDTRKNMGEAAAADIAACIKKLLAEKDEIYMIFAAAPSQNEMLEALVADPDVQWNRVHALHMDEYVNLPADAPQGFGNFLRRAIFDRVPFASVHLIGTDADSEATCARYDALHGYRRERTHRFQRPSCGRLQRSSQDQEGGPRPEMPSAAGKRRMLPEHRSGAYPRTDTHNPYFVQCGECVLRSSGAVKGRGCKEYSYRSGFRGMSGVYSSYTRQRYTLHRLRQCSAAVANSLSIKYE